MGSHDRRRKVKVNYLEVAKLRWSKFNWAECVQVPLALWHELPKFHQKALTALSIFTVLVAIIPFPSNDNTKAKDSVDTAAPQRKEISLDITPLDQKAPEHVTQTRSERSTKELVRSAWISYTVNSGDTLSQVFRNNDLPLSDLNALVAIEGNDKPLSNIRPGQLVRYKLNPQGDLDILQLEKSGQSIMFFRLSDGGFGRSQ